MPERRLLLLQNYRLIACTIPKNELFHKCFSQILTKALSGCVRIPTIFDLSPWNFYRFVTVNTAWKTTFLKSLNIIESPKIPSKYHLSINFLAQKNTVLLITEKIKTFQWSLNMVFHAKENIILSVFWELKDHLSQFLKYHASFVNTKKRSPFTPRNP